MSKLALDSRKLVDECVPTQDELCFSKSKHYGYLNVDIICKELETNDLYRSNVMWLSKTGFKSVSNIKLGNTIKSDDIIFTFKDDATKKSFEKFLSDNGLSDFDIKSLDNNGLRKFVF